MTGDMLFLQIKIQQMVREFRRLDHAELGLLMRIVLENCLMQGPLDRDALELPRLLGSKSRKTFNRILDALIGKGVVRETDGTIMALLAKDGIEHFQKKSANGKHAVGHRKDRKSGVSETNEPQLEAKLSGDCMREPTAAPKARQQVIHEGGDGAMAIPFDHLVDELQSLADRNGYPNLAETLKNEEAQRRVEAWREIGLRPEVIIKKALEVMKNKGGERISSWNYFEQAMQTLARAT